MSEEMKAFLIGGLPTVLLGIGLFTLIIWVANSLSDKLGLQ